MTDERSKSSQGSESLPRATARDVPLVRGADSEFESAPRGQRPAQLPRDPTYEAELAQVELAVLRDPRPHEDPSTKQGGRLAQQPQPQPASVTPESPTIRANPERLARSPEPPSSGGRSVASGTLLSVGAVDPRGKTERTLETPRMFISQQQGSEVYFKPGKIPAVTVHQTLETETIKLADSIDPRRAKTLPRIDRAALAQPAEPESRPDSEAGFALSEQPSSLDVSSARSPQWNQEQWDGEAEEESLRYQTDGQIHASLSPFRERPASSFSLNGMSTRPEPLAARRSDPPEGPLSTSPDTSTVPTHRDLPVHRIEASQPPPPPSAAVQPRSEPRSVELASEGPTTASIIAEEPERRAAWVNYVAFLGALLLAVVTGLYLTRGSGEQATPRPPQTAESDVKPQLELTQQERAAQAISAPARVPVSTPVAVEASSAAPALVAPARPRAETQPKLKKAPILATPPASSPQKSSSPKPPRETIF